MRPRGRTTSTSGTIWLCPPPVGRARASTTPPSPPVVARTGFTGRVLASTDGWTTCAQGHRHWGRAGAAGLLLHRDGADGHEVLLQHRASWSHHGGTWGTPGGALHYGETADDGALREVREELGLLPDDVVLGARSVDDHGGWSYTTVLAVPARRIEAGDLRLDGESDGVAWVPLAELDEVDLHPGLAASLARLRPLLEDARR
jgi:8-oxo-dGTP pyrophosphatase MutT (NUDIX family)